MWKDKKRLNGKEQVNHDELAGIESVSKINETDLVQCSHCKTLHNNKVNHKCYDLPYFSWACAICNRETSKWVPVEHYGKKYSKIVEKRKTIRIWNKPICEDCIYRAYKELKKE